MFFKELCPKSLELHALTKSPTYHVQWMKDLVAQLAREKHQIKNHEGTW